MYYFCTYFDQYYLARGLTLYRSLRKHCPDFKLWVLCMDDEAHRILQKLELPGINPISLEDFERNDQELQIAKTNRSRIEYYFTCTPSLPLFVLNKWPEVDLITYLDADLFFFDSPDPIFQEVDEASIGIIGHRFPPHLQDREIYGLYNVGWLSFRRDVNGIECLKWWRDRCLEWCYDRVENGKFADQKYLDKWPDLFKGVKALQHKGANLAPWNLANYSVKASEDGVWIDNENLIFFHFHSLKRVLHRVFNPSFHCYGLELKKMPGIKRFVIIPYLGGLSDSVALIKSIAMDMDIIPQGIRWDSSVRAPIRGFTRLLIDFTKGRYVIT
jgi:hypothetical protein